VVAAAVVRGSNDDDTEVVEVPAETLDVGTPLAAQPTDIESQSEDRPGDTAVTAPVDTSAGSSTADLGGAEPTGRASTDLGSPRTDSADR